MMPSPSRRPALRLPCTLLCLALLTPLASANVLICDKNGNCYFFDGPPCIDWALAGGSTCTDIVAKINLDFDDPLALEPGEIGVTLRLDVAGTDAAPVPILAASAAASPSGASCDAAAKDSEPLRLMAVASCGSLLA